MYYKDLTQDQVFNLSHLLEYAQVNQLDELKNRYEDIVKKLKLDQYRNSVLQQIMLNNIQIKDIESWLIKLKENTNNTIVHMECSPPKGKRKIINKKIIAELESKEQNILNVSHSEISGPQIVECSQNANDLEITLLLPSRIYTEDTEQLRTGNRKILIQKHALYHVYLWINVADNTFTISLPSFTKYHSIWDITSKRSMTDLLTMKIMKFMSSILGEIKYNNLNWVNNALRTITNEYYYHNNPVIEAEFEKIKSQKKFLEQNKEAFSLSDYLSNLSDVLDNEICKKRIDKAIDIAIERELIAIYKMKPCSHPFEVFLHEINKGVTSYKSRSGVSNEQTKVPPSLDTRDIILKILNSGSLKSLGLKYYSDNQKSVGYKFICKDNWFVLEQTNDTGTPKELVKNVLSEFKKYKGSEATLTRTRNI